MVGCDVLRGIPFRSTPHNSASAAPQNQANCNVQKAAWWAARCYARLVLKALSSNCFATSLLLYRYRITAKSIAPCRMHLQKNAWWAAMCYKGLHLKVCSKLGLGAKLATPKNAGHSHHASNSTTPHPQLRKIKQIATPKNLHGGLRCATRGWCTKSPLHAHNPASASPQNQANCIAQKFAWWAARRCAGLVPKSLLKIRA